MSLKDLYDKALPNTYVGTVRDKQEASAPTNQTLVNFLDGQPRGPYNRGATPPTDQIQKEFTRNEPNSYVLGGAQGITRAVGQNLTRWTAKALDIAFGGNGPTQLQNGYYTNQFRPAYKDVDNTEVRVHKYTPPASGKKNTFADNNLSALEKINMSPSGAPPRV